MNPFDQIPAVRAVPDGVVDRATELLRVYVAKVGSAKASDPFLLCACLSLAASENAVPLSDSKDLQVKTKKQQQDFSKAMASLRNTVSSSLSMDSDAASGNQLNMALVAVGATQIPLRAVDAMVQHATQKLREDGTIQRIQTSLDEASLFKYQLAATYLIVEATKSAPSKASFAKVAKLPLTSFDAIVARMRLDCTDLLERMVNPSTPKKRARESTDDGMLEKENADELRDTDPLAPPSLSLTRPRSNVKRIKLDASDAVADDGESPLRGRQARHPETPTADPDTAEDSPTRRRTSPRLAGKVHAMDVLASRTRPLARTPPRAIAVTVPVVRRSAAGTPGTRLQERMQQLGASTPGRRAPQTPHVPSKLRLQTVPPTASTASAATPTSGPSTPLTPTTRAMIVPGATTPDDVGADVAAAPTGTPTPHTRRATSTASETVATPSRPRRPRIAPVTRSAAVPAAPAAPPAPLENVPGFGSFNMVPLVDPRKSQRFQRFQTWKASMVERLQATLAAEAVAVPTPHAETMVV